MLFNRHVDVSLLFQLITRKLLKALFFVKKKNRPGDPPFFYHDEIERELKVAAFGNMERKNSSFRGDGSA